MTAAQPLAAPLHPTVLDALRNTPAAPLLDQPAQQVLAGIGLPTLPQFPGLPPLPGLPVLPPLDPAALVKPVTDLFSGFGDGNLNAGEFNPQTLMQNVSDAVSTAMQLASTGIALLQSMESSGTTAATAAAVDTVATSASISDQATRINLTTGGAAGTVATGYAQMAAVTTRFALTTAALGPTLVTPPGQAVLLASAIEAGTEAMAITAQTKAQLLAQSAEMTEAGKPVATRTPKRADLGKVQRSLTQGVSATSTSAPDASVVGRLSSPESMSTAASTSATTSSQSTVTQLLSQLQQVVTPLISVAQTVGKEVSAQYAAKPVADNPAPVASRPAGGTTAAMPVGSGGVGGASVAPAAAPLGGWQAEGVISATPNSFGTTVIPASTSAYSHEVLPPLMPGSGLIGADDRARSAGGGHESAVDARYGDELVGGRPHETAAPVIGVETTGDPDTPFSL
ncbi:hypothetical protein [Nocardia salmonicida]|uniref:hypothetical protein n=1 Tax=Nocardia salmonicida TaxID=53431 RepID=UPI002E29CF08|nr:hypothetical protein [Nocardia salmonicida]